MEGKGLIVDIKLRFQISSSWCEQELTDINSIPVLVVIYIPSSSCSIKLSLFTLLIRFSSSPPVVSLFFQIYYHTFNENQLIKAVETIQGYQQLERVQK